MKHRMISFLLCLALSLALASPALAAPTGYSDIPEGHWSAESVRRATELGLFQGIGGGKFGRGQPITRAAFTTALVRLFGWEEVSPSRPTFSDVTADRWFYAAVETACANGAVVDSGRPFRPTENITREEMATMLVRGLGYAPLAGAASSFSSPFTDVTTSKGYITVAYDLGIVGGIGDGKFAPNATASREQAAAMLVRVYDKLHTASVPVADASGSTLVAVPTPQAQEGQELPTTPLEPMAELYAQLRQLKTSGTDPAQAVLRLTAGGVRTLTSGGRPLASEEVSAEEVQSILSGSGVRLYYSDRYESAYCIYRPNSYQSAVLWYQSDESLSAKLQLARMFGVTRYLLA